MSEGYKTQSNPVWHLASAIVESHRIDDPTFSSMMVSHTHCGPKDEVYTILPDEEISSRIHLNATQLRVHALMCYERAGLMIRATADPAPECLKKAIEGELVRIRPDEPDFACIQHINAAAFHGLVTLAIIHFGPDEYEHILKNTEPDRLAKVDALSTYRRFYDSENRLSLDLVEFLVDAPLAISLTDKHVGEDVYNVPVRTVDGHHRVSAMYQHHRNVTGLDTMKVPIMVFHPYIWRRFCIRELPAGASLSDDEVRRILNIAN